MKTSNSNIIWIGGSPDSGKSTIAKNLLRKYDLQFYDYDLLEDQHHDELAKHSTVAGVIHSSSIENSWVNTTPELLLERANQSFKSRFPLVIRDLSTLDIHKVTLAEGFGLTPQLVSPYISNPQQAIWLVSTIEFKKTSSAKRNKLCGLFTSKEMELLAKENLLKRDMLIDAQIRDEAKSLGMTIIEVNNERTIEEISTLIELHFRATLN
ncbi:hypothetical protein [Paenibacillus sp. IHBB 10380]|uniref:hypothetical protein n=1 Tax=Paenibacillus sp. IHBB 10380 TaxID=1566358 RepID=UPI0005CFCEDC|nr:hypothetical protein [Paenibacillus sp. IHBB 10380]AJS59348.1 hypothetical protein UB51_13725 [Paenibacillus sp. IHBB 10380]